LTRHRFKRSLVHIERSRSTTLALYLSQGQELPTNSYPSLWTTSRLVHWLRPGARRFSMLVNARGHPPQNTVPDPQYSPFSGGSVPTWCLPTSHQHGPVLPTNCATR